ncbi:MAG: cell division protein SepF [Clostridiales bacterium]|nr:cell division protein SepF [Clostridiales bacterium]
MGFLSNFKEKVFPSNYGVDDEREFDDYQEEEFSERSLNQPESKPINTYGRPAENSGVALASRSSIEMKVVTPTKFDAVTQIADLLLEKKTVLLNLENTNKETAKRLIDFLSGVAYALGGDVKKVADNTFAVTPSNVAVSNEAVEVQSDEYNDSQF